MTTTDQDIEEITADITTLKRCVSAINTTDKMQALHLEAHNTQIEALAKSNLGIIEEMQTMNDRIKKLEDWINGL